MRNDHARWMILLAVFATVSPVSSSGSVEDTRAADETADRASARADGATFEGPKAYEGRVAKAKAAVKAATQADAEVEAKAEPRMDNLLQQALAQELAPEREVIVTLVEIPPNTTLERHWHPGEEFHYYLDGKVEIAIDGGPSVIGTPGKVGHVPYKKLHTAITGEEGAKILVFRVHEAGKPVRYLEGGETSDR